MNNVFSPHILFVILFALSLSWLIGLGLLFHRLKRKHPESYAALGSPSLLARAGRAAPWPVLRFLLARAHTALNDRILSLMADGLLLILILFIPLYGLSVVSIVL